MSAVRRKRTCLNVALACVLLALILIGFHRRKEFSRTTTPASTARPIAPRRPSVNKPKEESRTNVINRPNRYEIIQKKCETSGDSSDLDPAKVIRTDPLLNYMGALLRSHSLFYCAVPKVATRTILPFLIYLHAHDELLPLVTNQSASKRRHSDPDFRSVKASLAFNVESTDKILGHWADVEEDSTYRPNPKKTVDELLSRLTNHSGKPLELWGALQMKSFPYLLPRTLSNITRLFSLDFTRVMFVRHPFDRLASAFIDKIGTIKVRKSGYDKVRQHICRTYFPAYTNISSKNKQRLEKEIRRRCENVIPSFQHFIEYFLSGGIQRDVHWQPYSKLCKACLLKYNFVGKYETMQDDLERLLTRLQLPTEDWIERSFQKTGKTKANYQALYAKLPDKIICRLQRFYKDDFALFDYHPEDYLAGRKPIDCS